MPRSRPLFACLVLLVGLLFVPVSLVHAQAGTPTPTTATPTTPTPNAAPTVRSLPSIVPQLSVPIPGVNFTAPVTEGDQVSVPFLAQYINGIYSYMLAISTIVAIIVVIVGGFYYLLGATVGDARKGQTLIKDAVGGLVVLYASYFILYTVNPNLVSLRPLRLTSIDSVGITFSASLLEIPDEGTTPGASTFAPSTGSRQGYGSSRRVDPGPCPIQNLPPGHIDCGPGKPRPCPPGHCTAVGRTEGCVDNAVRNSSDVRLNAFTQALNTQLTSAPGPERVRQAAHIASACAIHIGSCNESAQRIRNWGGMGPRSTRSVNLLDGPGLPHPGDFICDESCRQQGATCSQDSITALNRVRDLVRSQQDRNADNLRPGDHIYVFNGSHQTSCGEHSILFLGWETPGSGYALILQSQWGDTVHMNRLCLKTSCNSFLPITEITPAVLRN